MHDSLRHLFVAVDNKSRSGFHINSAKEEGHHGSGGDVSQVVSMSSEEDVRESGTGILEFSPEKAGMDVTPANYNFPEPKEKEKRNSGTFSSIAGMSLYNSVELFSHIQT